LSNQYQMHNLKHKLIYITPLKIISYNDSYNILFQSNLKSRSFHFFSKLKIPKSKMDKINVQNPIGQPRLPKNHGSAR